MKTVIGVLIFIGGLGLGLLAALGIFAAGFHSGSISTNAAVFYDTQDFKQTLADNRPFEYGGYVFVPGKEKIVVRKIRYREVKP